MNGINYYFRNKAYYCRVLLNLFLNFLWTLLNLINASWQGVVLGKGGRFIGRTYFERFPDSSIVVGNNCRFRNKHASNTTGIYCPCIIATDTSEARIVIGNGCGFSGTRIRCAKSVVLGNNVRCGANTYIADTDAHTDDPRAGRNREVVIGDNVWLGMNVVVLKGVHIGENSVIGANSVVTKDIPENVVAVGNPCKVIRTL